MTRVLAILAALAVLVVGATSARAQAPDTEIDPGLALLAATEAYTAGPFAERLRIYIGPRPWEGRSDSALVRCDPLRQIVRLELGSMEVSFAEGQMVAVRRDNPRDAFVRGYTPPLTMATIAALLPPLPSPGLAMALDEDLNNLAPYLPIRDWRSARLDPTGAATLEGRLNGGSGGAITAQIERTGRINSIIAELGEDRWLSIQASAAPPGDPAAWIIDPAGRRRARSLADLAPPRAARSGDPAPDLSLVDAEGQPWRLAEALEAGPIALVLVRPDRDGAIAAACDALEALRARSDVTPVVAAIYTMQSWSPQRLREDREALRQRPAEGSDAEESGAAPAEPAIAVLWSVSPRQARDMAPSEPAAIVLITPDSAIRAIIPVAGRDPGGIEADVDAALGG